MEIRATPPRLLSACACEAELAKTATMSKLSENTEVIIAGSCLLISGGRSRIGYRHDSVVAARE
jgi:hypothetical protein